MPPKGPELPRATPPAASFTRPEPNRLVLAGAWTAQGLGDHSHQLDGERGAASAAMQVDAAGVVALDTAGAWVLQKLLRRLKTGGATAKLDGLQAAFAPLMTAVAEQVAKQDHPPAAAPPTAPWLARIGQYTLTAMSDAAALFAFVGEIALAMVRGLFHPARWRWRPILFNIHSAGVDALPIVGLLAFLLGVVVAYQGAAQLQQYGANIFVADLVGVSMLREFAPLITAIIVAGRSGSAYAAQIGTMAVTEEIDAMRTLGIAPIEMLVLPKLIALVIALPLLTVFADLMGVIGGMVMARAQLEVGYGAFLDRFVKAVEPTTALTGIVKAPIFAVIIVLIGCDQGFLTRGGADSVGRQTTRSVVQSIFLVIVADALFSVVFSLLDL